MRQTVVNHSTSQDEHITVTPRDARSAVISVGTGVAIGTLLTLLLQRGLAHWTTATGQTFAPLLYAIAILASVVLIASGIPARRATQIEPMEALCYE